MKHGAKWVGALAGLAALAAGLALLQRTEAGLWGQWDTLTRWTAGETDALRLDLRKKPRKK